MTADPRVLVVGAGPSGLVLAAQLLSRGIEVRLIDRAAGPRPESRAIGIHARTLEVLDILGLADAFVEQGHPVHHFRTYAHARNLLDLDFAHNGSRYDFVLHLPQHDTERVLRDHVRGLGGVIEYGHELVALRSEPDSVTATVREASGRESQVSAAYVVGCDGAHSRVREEIGVAFDGRDYPQEFLLADVALDGAGSEDAVHSFFRPSGLPVVCIPMGHGRWRVVMANAADRGGAIPSLDEVQGMIDERAPWRIVASDARWLSCFRCQLRSTRTYRRGRVLLAGDAAHVHSPAGGQGMNTGMMDAFNLGWKLALVAGGRAADTLLDTYAAERVPVASGVLAFTDNMIRLATLHQPIKRAVRDVVMPVATRLPVVQRRATQRISQLAVSYPASPLSQRSTARGGPKPGERVPDMEIATAAGTSRLYAQLRPGRHVLLVSDDDVRAAFEDASIGNDTGLVDVVSGQLGSRPSVIRGGGEFSLVRPDGYLAVRGTSAEIAGVLDYLRRLRAPTLPAPAA